MKALFIAAQIRHIATDSAHKAFEGDTSLRPSLCKPDMVYVLDRAHPLHF